MRAAVVFGGPSDEHDISILTGLQVSRAVEGIEALYWSKSGVWYQVDPGLEAGDFVDGAPRKSREIDFVATPGQGFVSKRRPMQLDAVLIACHGGPGEDGTLQGMLDLAGIRYTGPGQAASALGMDKLAFGAAMAAAGLPTLPRALATPGDRTDPAFDGPYIVKPRFGGSSIGIEVAEDWETVLALVSASPYFGQGAVVEPFLRGSRDLQVAVRTHPGFEMSAVEAPARAAEGIYSYDQKYLAWGGEVSEGRELPASLDTATKGRITELSRRITAVAGLRGVVRIDFLDKDGDLYVNEVNTIPGSMAAYLWVDPPIERARLFTDMLEEAAAGPTRVFSTAGSDGTALRSAGTIASKLG
ncbi:MAG TPA: ATP-grasp domain-containing protein [Acidimicrobiia bacterium]|jgi:D-alanine-D-alanine ligase|nr:ATP-grasp domain-containing protein [Acidimicrobiia bacterium]